MTLIGLPPSPWLLIFSIFFFLSLALMKREVELNAMAAAGSAVMHGRGYSPDDRMFVISFGISSGVASLVIFALFISAVSPAGSNYEAPPILWGVMAVVGYWLARMWLLTTRGEMNDDPILYAVRDRTSLIAGGLVAALALCAQIVPLG
jgi:4-hydroxybenzoate polyprenyltransferase